MAQTSDLENIRAEKPLRGRPAPRPMLSPSRITPKTTKKSGLSRTGRTLMQWQVAVLSDECELVSVCATQGRFRQRGSRATQQ